MVRVTKRSSSKSAGGVAKGGKPRTKGSRPDGAKDGRVKKKTAGKSGGRGASRPTKPKTGNSEKPKSAKPRKDKKAPSDSASDGGEVKRKRAKEGDARPDKDAEETGTEKPAKVRRIESAQEAKGIWEKLRDKKSRGNTAAQHKQVEKLVSLLEWDIAAFAFKPDTSRILQWCLKCGTKEQRSRVVEGILPKALELAADRYGRHVVMAALTGGRASREQVLGIYGKFLGKVGEVSRNNHSAEVLDHFYQTIATGAQRRDMYIEFLHGREYAVLSALRQKKKEIHRLADAIQEAGPEFGKLVYEAAKNALVTTAEKEASVRRRIVHDALRSFFDYAEEHAPDDAVEMAVTYAPVAVHLIHTRNGTSSFVTCVKLLDAKNRKKVVKSVQNEIRKVSEDDAGHIATMALYEQVDDTKLVAKSLLRAHLGKGVDEVVETLTHPYSHMPILSLLAPGQGRYFNPAQYGIVRSGSTTSVKDEAVRRKELLEAALPTVLSATEARTLDVLASPSGCRILLELIVGDGLDVAEERKVELISKIALLVEEASQGDAAQKPDVSKDEKGDEGDGKKAEANDGEGDLIDNPSVMRTLKYMLKLTNDTPYALGDAIYERMQGKLALLNRGSGPLFLKAMAKMDESEFAEEAAAATAEEGGCGCCG